MSEKLAELILFNKPRSEQASTGLESPQPYSRARSRRKFRVTLTALWSQAGTPAPAKLCSAGLKWSRLLCAVAQALRFGDSGRNVRTCEVVQCRPEVESPALRSCTGASIRRLRPRAEHSPPAARRR